MKGAAAIHKRTFERMVARVGGEVTLRMPATAVPATTAIDKVLGKRPAPAADAATTAYGEVLYVTAVGNTGDSITKDSSAPASIVMLGQTDNLDAVLRCKLAEVLIDPDLPHGRTQFHLAKDVIYQGTIFTVSGVDTSGLPPLGPYICWVGLKKAGVS